MKKTFITLFILLVLTFLAFEFQTPEKAPEKIAEAPQKIEPDFKKFVNENILVAAPFHKHYSKSSENLLTATSLIRSQKPLASSFKIEALQNIREANNTLDALETSLADFKDTKYSDLHRECLTFCHLARKMMDEHQTFISKPEAYINDLAQIKRYSDKTTLLKEQMQIIAQLSEDHAHNHFSTHRVSKQTIEFKFSNEEIKATDKWKKSSFDALIEDAHKGDAAALYMVGLCLLDGHGMAINTGNAHDYFSASAALGFSPAIGHVRAKYMNYPSNPFLALVYTNLMISFGHKEYSQNYQEQKDLLVKTGGEKVVQEIERIALEKKAEITNIRLSLELSKDKREAALRIYDANGITSDDTRYGMEYWNNLFKR